MFDIRIHCIDYCLAGPTKTDVAASRAPIVQNKNNIGRESDGDDGNDSSSNARAGNEGAVSESRVPIIRVFGRTLTGRIACAHIHGVFPYFYVPYADFPFSESDRVIVALRNGIDQAVGRPTVLAITLVRGVPFYGFHVGFQLYLKIYLFDPALMTRVAELLRQGRVASIPKLQPHESHIPFLLQFMTDYNLYGCGSLKATEALPKPSRSGLGSCPLEVDIFAHSIRNRDAVPERWQHDNFPEVPTDPNQRLVYSMAAVWREMAAKYDKQGKKSAEERKAWETISTQDAFAQLGASSSDPRRTPAPWLHEEKYREQVADIIEAEQLRARSPPRPRDPLEDCVPTMRQSVEDFYPATERAENRKRKRGLNSDDAADFFSGDAGLSPSPDFEHQLGMLLDRHEKGSAAVQLSNGWLRSQRQEPRRPQELPPKMRHQRDPRGVHRSLSKTFPVVKSAFPREKEKTALPVISEDGSESAANSDGAAVPSTPEGQLVARRHNDRDSTSEGDALAVSNTTEETRDTAEEACVEVDSWSAETSTLARSRSNKTVVMLGRPPAMEDVMVSLAEFGPEEIHQKAYYGDDKDIPKAKKRQTGIGKTAFFLPAFDPCGRREAHLQQGNKSRVSKLRSSSICSWEIAAPPPSFEDVETWLASEAAKETAAKEADAAESRSVHRRIAGASLSQEERAAVFPRKPTLDLDMRTLCLEVHANSRGTFLPNPERDAVQCVCWKVAGGGGTAIGDDGGKPSRPDGRRTAGVITVSRATHDEFSVEVATDERDLLLRVVRLTHSLDPDLLAGYEIVAASWGYLSERAALYDLDLWQLLSRVSQPRVVPFYERGQCVTGRYMLSIGQTLRGHVDLRQYTLESAAWHVLGRRVPMYRAHVLTAWTLSGRSQEFGRVLRYYRLRTAVGQALIDAIELVSRTSEQARILGVDFASVLDRGSQFKVESVMLRVAKPENFVMPSPSHEQVGQQNAAECIPMVLEPRSAFYSSPVVVLDFTSLYPSLMIAYNLCYSTFAGRLDPLYHEKKQSGAQQPRQEQEQPQRSGKVWPHEGKGGSDLESGDTVRCHDNGSGVNVAAKETADRIAKFRKASANKMGFTTYQRPSGLLERLSQLGLVVSPTGMMYVSARTRQSLLAKMLAEILDTRAMVKAAMKKTPATNVAERQRLNNRQLALKLLANVTYGYTSASFSGRMPCVEVADSIVQTGRQTLDRAIALIHSVQRWNAEVVYGDTDSLFVHLPGRTREQAFQIGAEMADAVTAANPHPVRLKFEKVYHPCVLLAKKRYVGYEFDVPDQTEPIFDAKGIETVRRDGSPVAAKMLEQCLRILFDTADLSRVKSYVQARFDDIIHDRLSLADLCFAKEVRPPGSYSAPPPGAVVASRRLARDPRALLLYKERVPYVVVAGPPGTPLRDRSVAPEDVVGNRHLRIDSDYYIQNSVIPPLDRIFRLMDVDVERWYLEMPRVRMPLRTMDPAPTQQQQQQQYKGGHLGQQTLDSWLRGSRCARCDRPVRRKRRRGYGIRRKNALDAAVAAASVAHGELEDVDRHDREKNTPGPLKTPVLCKRCGKDNLGTLVDLQCRARDAERAYRTVLDGCRSCAGLGPLDEVRCENLTCPVYFVRTERAVQARAAQAKVPLMDLLARRGLRDLEW
ncbi:DNA polymerase zeta catalytic [Niveomyces insectorum RCEF 264]|uniref:DNA polymerase n=1 Tax=Niveomyces insectorum RCEF 264 TaxID=1081102 RepID=A0A167W3T0_9HYPO|nr:DNA polymerase zeta catalytic [Niveomyces insectorum RCEF 264]